MRSSKLSLMLISAEIIALIISSIVAIYVLAVEPAFITSYVSISGTLRYLEGNAYGPYYPYAVSVRIDSVSPSGLKLTVTINVNGQTVWSGALGAGESSPTITANGLEVVVYVVNYNYATVSYTGTITLIYS